MNELSEESQTQMPKQPQQYKTQKRKLQDKEWQGRGPVGEYVRKIK